MNKQEKIICLILGLALVWCWVASRGPEDSKQEPVKNETAIQKSEDTTSTNTNQVVKAELSQATNVVEAATEAKAPVQEVAVLPSIPEKTLRLANDELELTISSWGAVVTSAKLKKYAQNLGKVSESNPPVELSYAKHPLGELHNIKGVAPNSAYDVKERGDTYVILTNVSCAIERKISIAENYKVTFEDSFGDENLVASDNSISLGTMAKGSSESDILSVDSLRAADNEVIHHGDNDESTIYAILTGGSSGGCGCGGARNVVPGEPNVAQADVPGTQNWIALKNRFFVTSFVGSSQSNNGFTTFVDRNTDLPIYSPESASIHVNFPAGSTTRTTTFYVGPKQQSLLWDSGMKDVMEFGMWSWICYPMVWILNFFYSFIPNYGIAIILLTILVRIVFWPLTRKSTEGMKKMQEIQPLLKEIQAKYKNNPQRLQQETWNLYREKKVNPLSSCLPMLIQIPIFIALFNVLRSMVELRYAGFLWIGDLSEPEHLFASWFPFGGLNILPILMAATMFLQSKLTPSAGDKSQQRMMMVFMPLMMLFMFYNFASALSLYWTVSQLLSILQLWMMQRSAKKKSAALEPEVIDPPQATRQMRRHS